jgi:lysophospholipase L1-like esterase
MRPIFIVVIAALAMGCDSTPTGPTPPPAPSAPVLTCPQPISQNTVAPAGATVTYSTPAASGGLAPVTVTCSPPSGSTFPIGMTTVSCTATDAGNRSGSCAFPVSLTFVPSLTKTTFLAFGDSVTSGEVTVPVPGASVHGFPDFRLIVVPPASYPTQLLQQLSSRYSAQGIAVTNAGMPGEWAVSGAERLPGVLMSVRPEVVLLLEGYNDPLQFSSGMSAAVAAIDTMAKDARFRGCRVFIASLTPGRPGASHAIPASLITSYNSRLRTVAAGEQAVFVDLYEALGSDVNTYIGIDGLHPTEAGYRRMADAFFAAIRADLEVK